MVATASHDTPSLDAWARLMRMSRSTLCHRCRAAGARPKALLDLGRVVRTIALGDPRRWQPEQWLVTFDERTVLALLARVGVKPAYHREKPTVSTVLAQQAAVLPAPTLAALERWLGVTARSSS